MECVSCGKTMEYGVDKNGNQTLYHNHHCSQKHEAAKRASLFSRTTVLHRTFSDKLRECQQMYRGND